ncbi:hypothetical protein K1T71_013883 [Dendrolimus kikuchii]|uniref:Uncharacterized protein n=1 Tax=Dendrolimus kikuchii TaxID=765133 RepID=A0ACC1CGD9_9NEOP|nr:hypothetical protein K1T71_013883 [Dendrolimus kikuchii]
MQCLHKLSTTRKSRFRDYHYSSNSSSGLTGLSNARNLSFDLKCHKVRPSHCLCPTLLARLLSLMICSYEGGWIALALLYKKYSKSHMHSLDLTHSSPIRYWHENKRV